MLCHTPFLFPPPDISSSHHRPLEYSLIKMTQLWNHFDSRDLLLIVPSFQNLLFFISLVLFLEYLHTTWHASFWKHSLLPSSWVTAFSITAGVTGYMTYASPIRCLSCVGPILTPEPFSHQTIGVTALLLYTFINWWARHLLPINSTVLLLWGGRRTCTRTQDLSLPWCRAMGQQVL